MNDNRSWFQRVWSNPSALAIVFAIVASGYAAQQGFVEIDLTGLATAELGTLFLTLIFVALVIERAVEVYLNNRYNPEKLGIEQGISEAEMKLDLAEAALKREMDRQQAADMAPDERAMALEATKEARHRVEEDLRDLREAKRRALPRQIDLKTRKAAAAGAVATLLGVIAAVAGVRILGQFLPRDAGGAIAGPLAETCDATMAANGVASLPALETLDPRLLAACEEVDFQLMLFRFADVLLTAFLLAGGADGIHRLLKDFSTRRSDIV